MKSSKYARTSARRLLRLCLGSHGYLEQDKVAMVCEKLTREQPRDYRGILAAFCRFIRVEEAKRRVLVESAQEMTDEARASVTRRVEQAHGAGLTYDFVTRPDLIAGVKLRIGDQVYDGSIQARLARLAKKV